MSSVCLRLLCWLETVIHSLFRFLIVVDGFFIDINCFFISVHCSVTLINIFLIRKIPKNHSKSEERLKKEVPHRKGDQKSRRNNIDLEARETKRKNTGDIHLRHHHQAHLMTILVRVDIETMRARKAQIPDLVWFLRRISTYTAYLQISPHTPTLILTLTSKR